MREYSLTKKILSLLVVAALLSLRLGSLTDEIFATPVEEAIFDCAFIAEENHTEGKSIKVKAKRMFELILTSVDAIQPHIEIPEPAERAVVPVLLPQDIPFEIFIPPENDLLS
jgi:hypothetical protein